MAGRDEAQQTVVRDEAQQTVVRDEAQQLWGMRHNRQLWGMRRNRQLWGMRHNRQLWGMRHNRQLWGMRHNRQLWGMRRNRQLWRMRHNRQLWGMRHNRQLISVVHVKTWEGGSAQMLAACWSGHQRWRSTNLISSPQSQGVGAGRPAGAPAVNIPHLQHEARYLGLSSGFLFSLVSVLVPSLLWDLILLCFVTPFQSFRSILMSFSLWSVRYFHSWCSWRLLLLFLRVMVLCDCYVVAKMEKEGVGCLLLFVPPCLGEKPPASTFCLWCILPGFLFLFFGHSCHHPHSFTTF